jgi:hypothetical protein
MSSAAHGRRARTGWDDDLDALVIEEMEAINGRPREPRQRFQDGPPRPAEARRGPPEAASEFAHDEVPEDDEEAFIERAVDFLRGRPDAEALLDAIHAALYDEDPEGPEDHFDEEPTPQPSPQASAFPQERPARPPAPPEAPPEGPAGPQPSPESPA